MKLEPHRFFSILFFSVIMASVTVFSLDSSISAEQHLITLSVTDETLEKTLKRISEISGYTIDLESKSRWYDLPVTVHLLNVPLEQAISRILGNRVNHATLWNDKEKTISIIISEISQKKRVPVANKASGDHGEYGGPGGIGRFGGFHKQLPGQGIKFIQASQTADY